LKSRVSDSFSSTADAARASRPYALLFALVFPTLLTYGYFIHLADRPTGVQQIVYSLGKILQFAFPVVWVYGYHRRRLAPVGLSRSGLIEGLAFGFAVAGAMLALYGWVLGPYGFFDGPDEAIREKVQDLGLDTAGKFIAAALFYSLIHSLLEEYYWRWFVFGELRWLLRLGPAILVSSLAFMAHHVILLGIFLGWQSPATYLFSAAIAVGGAVWAWIYHRSGTLYGPWFSHLLIDAAIFVIGYDLIRESL
jgi:uncharacterized protein